MSRLSRRLRRWLPPRRRRAVLVGLSVVVVFTLALVFWAGRDPAKDAAAGPLTHPPTAPSTAAAAPAPTGSGSATGSAGTTPTGGLSLTPLPPLSTSSNIRGAGDSPHTVTITLTSDKPILRMAYLMRGGHPTSAYRGYLQSPVSITTTAYGQGLVTEIAGQSAPGATQLTCTASVDGQLKSRRTVKGSYTVAVCFG